MTIQSLLVNLRTVINCIEDARLRKQLSQILNDYVKANAPIQNYDTD